jgi:hypothetical protein
MHTIILYHPRYTGLSAQHRYAVNIRRDGWAELLPVGKKGAILESRLPQRAPWKWDKVNITEEALKP